MSRSSGSAKTEQVLIRFDPKRKRLVRRAAELNGLSVSDYVRSRIVNIALRDLEEIGTGVLRLKKEDQVAFWRALQSPAPLTRAQKALGTLVRSVM